jgi:hypothetical protein
MQVVVVVAQGAQENLREITVLLATAGLGV